MITAEITPMKILNINILEDGEMLLLSIPLTDNVVDLDNELIFSLFDKDGKQTNGGTKKITEFFNLFKENTNNAEEILDKHIGSSGAHKLEEYAWIIPAMKEYSNKSE